MPGYDATGPAGWGPMTGGGRGNCGMTERGVRRGFGSRMGRSGKHGRRMCAGRGWGGSPFPAGGTPAQSKAEELEMLRAESEQINLTLNAIQKRMETLEKQDE